MRRIFSFVVAGSVCLSAGALFLAGCGGLERSSSRSGAGSRLAAGRVLFVKGQSLLVRGLTGGRPWRLASGVNGLPNGPGGTWSPDGSRVAFVRATHAGGAVFVIGALKTRPRQLARRVARGTAYLSAPFWTKDGKTLLFSDGTSLYSVGSDGSNVRLLVRAHAKFLDVYGWSPVARQALYVRWLHTADSPYLGPSGAILQSVSADGGQVRTLLTTDQIGEAAWSPDGRFIAYVRGCCQLGIVDSHGRKRRDLPTAPEPGQSAAIPDTFSFAWGPGPSTLVYARGETVYELSPATGKTRTLARLRCPWARCDQTASEVIRVSGDGSTAIVSAFYFNLASDNPAISRTYAIDLTTGVVTSIADLPDEGVDGSGATVDVYLP